MATYYISPTGNDTTGNGSSGNPWKTFEKTQTSGTSGDTIYVMPGTYTMGTLTFTKSMTYIGTTTTPSNQIVSTNLISARWTNNGAVISFSYIKFTGQSLEFYPFLLETTDNGEFSFSNCHIDIGIVANGSLFYAAILSNVRLTSCLITTLGNNYSGGRFYAAVGLGYRNLYLINNTFYLVSLTGILTGSASAVIKNNIFYFSSGASFYSGGIYYSMSSLNNCYYNVSSLPSGTGDITSDPLFVDAPNGNFNLRPTSPCIDTGTLI